MCLLSCNSLPHEYPYKQILALVEYPLIPSCSCVSQKSSKYYSILQKSLVAYCSTILVCLHCGCFPYVWQYSLVSLGTVILILLIQHECECTQSSFDPFKLSFRLRRHFEHELVLNQTICRRIVPLAYSIDPSLIRTSASDPLFWKS